jgi:hypothetical protein
MTADREAIEFVRYGSSPEITAIPSKKRAQVIALYGSYTQPNITALRY